MIRLPERCSSRARLDGLHQIVGRPMDPRLDGPLVRSVRAQTREGLGVEPEQLDDVACARALEARTLSRGRRRRVRSRSRESAYLAAALRSEKGTAPTRQAQGPSALGRDARRGFGGPMLNGGATRRRGRDAHLGATRLLREHAIGRRRPARRPSWGGGHLLGRHVAEAGPQRGVRSELLRTRLQRVRHGSPEKAGKSRH
jgi:hypothetical protein